MATKKKAVKPAAKKPAPKKAVPVKKQAKPVAKNVAKPAAKKPVTKASKPAVKAKSSAKATPVAKKPAAKPVVKQKVKPVVIAKPVAKKPVAKPIQKPVAKKPVIAPTPVQKPMTKKTEEKQPAVKAAKQPPAKAPAIVKVVSKPTMATNTKDIKVTPAKPVVLPKINTKTSRKYQPDFTKSVLDQPKNDPGAPIVRYNDADLKEFRDLINRKLDAAKKELNYLQGLITRKDEMGGDESDNRYMTMEDGSLSMEREQLSQMASRQITFIDHLEKALMRIENKTYGICRVTGKLIDKARLRAVPHATLSIEAKMGITK
jgi:RNA polymerase-binding transcription factor DksA